jgi:hypothetical protein
MNKAKVLPRDAKVYLPVGAVLNLSQTAEFQRRRRRTACPIGRLPSRFR